jgi:hypothetical protein
LGDGYQQLNSGRKKLFALLLAFVPAFYWVQFFFHVLPEISTVLGSQLGYSVMFGFLLNICSGKIYHGAPL